MVLIILISIPIFNVHTWEDKITSYDRAIYQLEYFASISSEQYDAAANIFIF